MPEVSRPTPLSGCDSREDNLQWQMHAAIGRRAREGPLTLLETTEICSRLATEYWCGGEVAEWLRRRPDRVKWMVRIVRKHARHQWFTGLRPEDRIDPS